MTHVYPMYECVIRGLTVQYLFSLHSYLGETRICDTRISEKRV
eukprot:COSAG03_NODE_759_length_5968_cov_39.290169_6_plen_43_part_00